MNGMKTEEAGSRKKYLAPLVVIMLCLVALTGAAYAYSSTLTVDNNNVTAKTLTLDLSTGVVADDAKSAGNIVTITDNFGYTKSDDTWIKGDVIKYEFNESVVIAKYHVKVTGEADFNKFKVSSTDLGNLTPFKTVNAENNLKLSDIYTFSYVIGTSEDGHEILANGVFGDYTALSSTYNPSTATVDWYVTVTATMKDPAPATASGTLETVTDVTAGHTAADYKAGVAGQTFSLELEAKYVAA